MIDIYAKIILIGWIVVSTCAYADDKLFNTELLEIPYLGKFLAIITGVTVFATPIYAIYFVITVL